MSSPTLLNRLTFRQLQVFQAVHQQRSYSRAAEQLGQRRGVPSTTSTPVNSIACVMSVW